MELHLDLSLSSSSSSSTHDFDLNDYNAEGNSMFGCMEMEDLKKRKLCVNYGDEDHDCHVPKTLPLLSYNKSNQDHDVDDDDFNEVQSTFIFINHKNGEEENGVIGWPPVKSRRKKLCHRSKSMFVKVQMEGIGIARKIDLNLHHSYHTLVHTLAHMFGKCDEDVKLTYQDKQGDWLLAGDVPWGSFIETAQRLKLLKSNCG